jgi:SPP1 family predicted phage head-tail adaptor
VKAGELRQPITLRRLSGTSRDSAGAVVKTFTELGPWFAKVEFKEAGSDELTEANQTTNRTKVNFTIRNNPQYVISHRDEIVYNGRIYQIRSVLDYDPMRCYLLIETFQIGEYKTAA